MGATRENDAIAGEKRVTKENCFASKQDGRF